MPGALPRMGGGGMGILGFDSYIAHIYFVFNARAGGILQILQSDCLWERAGFFYLVRQPSLGSIFKTAKSVTNSVFWL